MEEDRTLAALVAEITAAYVSNHQIEPGDLSRLIHDIRRSLTSTSLTDVSLVKGPDLTPAVPVSESVQADYIICLEDGARYKSMKRHLRARYGLSPVEYRRKWGLPADYPMVAPNYGKNRSTIAKKFDFGHTVGPAKKQKTVLENTDIALATLHSIGDAVICTDTAFVVTFMNPVAEKFTGWSSLEATGRPITEVLKLVKNGFNNKNHNPAHECIQLGEAYTVEEGTLLLSQTGDAHDVGFSAAPVRTSAGDVIGSVLIFNDLTGMNSRKKVARSARKRHPSGKSGTLESTAADRVTSNGNLRPQWLGVS